MPKNTAARSSRSPRTITEFDVEMVKQIMAECRDALGPIAEKYGLKLENKGRTFHPDSLPVLLQFSVKQTSENGEVLDLDAQAFLKYCQDFGFEKDDLGKEFNHRGDTFKIAGLQPRRPKFSLVAKNVRTGKIACFPSDWVVGAIGKTRSVKFFAGMDDKGVSVTEWVAERKAKGHKIVSGWKEESVTRQGVVVGPLLIWDVTEQDVDRPARAPGAKRSIEEIGIPFGAPYHGHTDWMREVEAHDLALSLGIEYKPE